MKKSITVLIALLLCLSVLPFSALAVESGGSSGPVAGDANGDGSLNGADLIRIRKHLAGMDVEIDLDCADVNGDGNVNGGDLVRLRKYMAGMDVELVAPVTITYTEPDPEHIVEEGDGEYYVDNQVLITAEENVTKAQIAQLVEPNGGTIVGYISLTNDYQIEYPSSLTKAELDGIVAELNAKPEVSLATIYNLHEVDTTTVPNDAKWANTEWSTEFPDGINWGVEAIHAPEAWEYADQMTAVNVGIIDSMFDTAHEDLTYTRVWNNPASLASEESEDTRCHGTHVSGTIGAGYNNGIGITGVAPKVNLFGYSIMGGESDSVITDPGKSLVGEMEWKYALANLLSADCRVINVSMGLKFPSSEVSQYVGELLGAFLQKLIDKGYDFLIVQAAGNKSKEASYNGIFCGITNPDVASRILVVGAVGNNGSHRDGLFGWWGDRVFDGYYYAPFSNYGARVDIVAPGVKIYSTVPGNGYEDSFGLLSMYQWSGTSMAAPHVTGAAAMCFAINPALSGSQVKGILVNSATTYVTDSNSDHTSSSYPMLDVAAAVALARVTGGEAIAPVNPAGGVVMGNVSGTDSDSVNAGVSAYRTSSSDGNLSDYVASTQTDSEGNFEVVLEAGTYSVSVYAEGYLPYAIADVEIAADTTNYLDNIVLIPEREGDQTAEITGVVRDALTGDIVEGVTVNLRLGWNVMDGTADVSTTTDSSGRYSATTAMGNYTAEFIKSGYVTGYANVVCSPDGTSQDGVITPELGEDEYRIVLTWGETPQDLDSHLSGPLEGNDIFHVYYRDMNAYGDDNLIAELDVDDTTSYGPETVTLLKANASGVYRYCVHNYSDRYEDNSNSLSMSGAKVVVYNGNVRVATFNVPINKVGTVWNVFEIRDGAVHRINTFESIQEPEYVSLDASQRISADVSSFSVNSVNPGEKY